MSTPRQLQVAAFKTPRRQQIEAWEPEAWEPPDMGDCIVQAVAQRFGIKTDPRDGRGVKDAWYGHLAQTIAARMLRQELGWTKKRVAERMGCSVGSTCIINCDLPPDTWVASVTIMTRARRLAGIA